MSDSTRASYGQHRLGYDSWGHVVVGGLVIMGARRVCSYGRSGRVCCYGNWGGLGGSVAIGAGEVWEGLLQ